MKIQIQTGLLAAAWLCCGVGVSMASQEMQLAQSSRLFGGDTLASMQIDIKPDSETNTISTNFGRVIPIAILGSSALDVESINPRTVRLEGVGVMLIGKSDKSLCKKSDINADGHPDLLCDLRTTGFRVTPGSYTIRLRAETYGKTSLRGSDQLTIIAN